MRVHSVYVVMKNGLCLFEQTFSTMPPAPIITGMLAAMQSFIFEVSGSYAKKLSAGGFVFHLERVGQVSIVLATSEEERPVDQISQLSLRFLKKYGKEIADWRGNIDLFDPFMQDVSDVLGLQGIGTRVDPVQTLSSFALISLKPELQNIARQLIMKKEVTAKELTDFEKETEFQTSAKLDELVELGYVGRVLKDNITHYFV